MVVAKLNTGMFVPGADNLLAPKAATPSFMQDKAMPNRRLLLLQRAIPKTQPTSNIDGNKRSAS
jgi:hypothetical protein